MIAINVEQMKSLEGVVFQERLQRVLGEHFSEKKAMLGPRFREAIAEAVARARGHGFEAYGDLSKYVMLEFALHPGFDQDPALPWAAELLAADDIPTQAMRIQLLLERALDALRPPPAGTLASGHGQAEPNGPGGNV